MKKQIALVFAANTDCGKTLLSAGLVRAAISKQRPCHYIKPVQTGFDFDEDKVKSRNNQSPLLTSSTLFHFKTPVSPHLAAAAESANPIPSSFDIRTKLKQTIQQDNTSNFFVVETAGGVLSPFPDETPTADALERFADKNQVHCVLVGDGRLGGISQTLAALEALEKRRFSVSSLVLFASDEQSQYFGNEAYFKKRFHCDPEVRRVPFDPANTQGELGPEFFDHPVFSEVYEDVLQANDKDKRTLNE